MHSPAATAKTSGRRRASSRPDGVLTRKSLIDPGAPPRDPYDEDEDQEEDEDDRDVEEEPAVIREPDEDE
jgi:hypothetical protein